MAFAVEGISVFFKNFVSLERQKRDSYENAIWKLRQNVL